MKFKTINPATGETIAEHETIPPEDALKHAQKSKREFESWKKLDIRKRADYLLNLADVLRKRKTEFARLITLEMGKPLKQSIAEVEKCAWTSEVYGREGSKWLEEEVFPTDAQRSVVTYEPLGVVLSVMPWNFPFWQALRFGIPTVLAGNTTLLRHSSVVPQCALAIEEALKDADFPEYVLKTIITDHATVEALIASDLVAGVSLTGSVSAGSKVAELAGRYLKKSVLELGGSDPFIVLDDSKVDDAASCAASARLINSGQSCIAAKRFIVEKRIFENFKNRFVSYVEKQKVGDPMDMTVDVGPVVREEQLTELETQLRDAKKKGARILTGGERIGGKGFFYKPTVLDNVTEDMNVMTEEVFGPVAPLIAVKDEDDALRIANNTEFGLGAAVWTTNPERATRIAGMLESGVVFINGMVKSDPRMPFGGVKKSGLGRELSKYGIREFVNIKSINFYALAG